MAGRNIVGCNINCLQPGISPCVVDCDITDCNGHGTHIGGCAAASGGISGIAPGASLVALKVFEECSSGGVTPVDIRRAINWAVDNSEQYNISVISISIGYFIIYTDGHCDGRNAFITIFNGINLALEVGIGTVIAAGNGGSSEGIDAPACLSNAIPVAATKKDDTVANYSNYNELVKLFATGGDVDGGGWINTTEMGGGYGTTGGTSASTPMVAASIAILRQFLDAIGEIDTLDPFELEEILFQTGDPIIGLPPESWTRINVQAAVQRLIDDLVTPGDLNLDGVISTNDLLLLFANWGTCPDCNDCPADLDGDCNVSTSDLLILFANWG